MLISGEQDARMKRTLVDCFASVALIADGPEILYYQYHLNPKQSAIACIK